MREDFHQAKRPSEWLAYLEKHKYDRMQPIYDSIDSFESALDKAWKAYNDSGARTVDGCEDDYVECAHAKGFREGYLFGLEKQKENPKSADSIPSDCVSDAKCEDRSPKHSDSDGTDIRDTPAYWKGWDDAMKQKEQKHPNGCFTCDEYKKGYEAGRLNGFTAGYNKAMKEVEQKEQKPAEWSEEEEQMFGNILNHYSLLEAPTDGNGISKERYIAFIKSFRPQPKQEWSKEDENKIERLAFLVSIAAEKEMISSEECIDLRRLVKSYHPQSKKEWSEEDEKMIDDLIKFFNEKLVILGEAKNAENTVQYISYKKVINWLKSLRPSWRPSEEQIYSLGTVVKGYDECTVGSVGYHLKEMYEQLKKLM